MGGGQLAGPLVILIWPQRLTGRIHHLTARVAAGTPPLSLCPAAAPRPATQLQQLLAEPNMVPLLADPHAGRLLGTLCRMLGGTPPVAIATPRLPVYGWRQHALSSAQPRQRKQGGHDDDS